MTPPTFLDKLIHLVANSGPIGFALFFAGSVVFLVRYFRPDAISFIDPGALGYIFYIGLFGAGLVFLKVWTWASKRTAGLWAYLKQRNKYVTAADRTDELLPEEMMALCWMLVNQDQKIVGSRLNQPFDGLLRKGFLMTTDGKELHQVFLVHPYVLARSERVLSCISEKRLSQIKGIEAPWVSRNRSGIRI